MHQILIVEDDPALSQGIRLALGQEGRQFVQAGTIGQAERELAERTFDLLILDLNLPDGNGLDLLSRLGPLRPAGADPDGQRPGDGPGDRSGAGGG